MPFSSWYKMSKLHRIGITRRISPINCSCKPWLSSKQPVVSVSFRQHSSTSISPEEDFFRNTSRRWM
ncbi:hypothetical protein BJX62DRAFT_100843 [Aspergillus germanicus]